MGNNYYAIQIRPTRKKMQVTVSKAVYLPHILD